MADITVGIEKEGPHGWEYEVQVAAPERAYRYRVTLSWSDYDHWCHGRVPPYRVVKAAFVFLLSRESASAILPRFDCSIIRRFFPDADQELPKMIGAESPPNRANAQG